VSLYKILVFVGAPDLLILVPNGSAVLEIDAILCDSLLFTINYVWFRITFPKKHPYEFFFLQNIRHSKDASPVDFGVYCITCFGNMRNCTHIKFNSHERAFWKTLVKTCVLIVI
jgi:hypothetical protein